MFVFYSKSFFTKSNKLFSIDLAINLKSFIALLAFGNIIYLYFLHLTAKAKYYQEKIDIQKYYIKTFQSEVFKLDFLVSNSILFYVKD